MIFAVTAKGEKVMARYIAANKLAKLLHFEDIGTPDEMWKPVGEIKEMVDFLTDKYIMALTPCDLCKYNPPSSNDGKPCSICPACAKDEEEQK